MKDEEDLRQCYCGMVYDPEEEDGHWIVQTNRGWRCVK